MKKNVKENFRRLKDNDIYTILLFILFQIGTIPKYKILRDLTFVLDRKTLIKLCELYGGHTVTFPTIEQLQESLELLKMYESININDEDRDSVLEQHRELKETYLMLEDKINNFNV